EPSDRRMIAAHAAGKLEEHRLPGAVNAVAPGGMLLAEPRTGTDEGSEAGWMAAGARHGRLAFRRHVALGGTVADGGDGRLRCRIGHRRGLAHQDLLGR